MALTNINNQAVKLYAPGETKFNDQTSKCHWHLDYFPCVYCDDISEIVLDTSVVEEDIENDGEFSFALTGTTTSTSFGTLRDTNALFQTNNVQPGDWVQVNIGGNGFSVRTTVNAVVSEFILALNADIVTGVGQSYEVSKWQYDGDCSLANNDWEITFIGVATKWLQQATLIAGNIYKVQFDVTDFTIGALGEQLRVLIGGNTVLTLDETNLEATTYVVYGIADTTVFRFEVDGGLKVTLDNVDVSKMSAPDFFIIDCDDDTIEYQSDNNDLLVSPLSGQVKLNVDWSNVLSGYICEGCFFVGILDVSSLPSTYKDDRIDDGTFTSGAPWNFGANWSYTGTRAQIVSGAGSGDLTQTSLALDFQEGIAYRVQFTIEGYTKGSVTVKLFAGAVEIDDLGTVSGDGTYILESNDLTADCDTIKFIPDATDNTYFIDNVSAFFSAIPTTLNYETGCFNVTDDCDCTVKLSGTNLDNAFGIDFLGTSYNPSVRVKGELRTPKYDGEKENEEDSAGVSKTLYFKSEKKRDLFLWQLPEHLHDFIRLLIGYDTFKVDDVDYVSTTASYTSEAEPLAGKLPDLSNSTTELRLKDDLNENKFC